MCFVLWSKTMKDILNLCICDSHMTMSYSCMSHVYTYMYMCMYNKISEKRGHEYEREQEGYMGGFGGRSGKGKLYNYSEFSKDKISKWLLISTYLWGSCLQISLCY